MVEIGRVPSTIPLSLTASWSMPHSKLSNLSLVSSGGPGPGSKSDPSRLPSGKGSGLLGLGGSSGESVSGSSSGPLFGPEIDYTLPQDAVLWLPFEATAQIYARVLLGTLEIDGEETQVQDYAVGLRLAVPLWRPPDFTLSPYLSAGPAYLRTEFGHVTGLNGALGLRGDYRVSKSFTLTVQVEVDAFFASDFFSWGPAGTAGVAIGF